jgi:N-acetylglucosaminyldiphosphoundecaprenol N-acetyl-beta-D-mannosaminyltransferase
LRKESLKRIKILGIPVDYVDRTTVLDSIENYIQSGTQHFLSFINPEIIMKCRNSPELKQAIEKADLIAPDGVGLLWASKMIGSPISERVTGSDIIFDIANLSHVKGYSLYFLGAEPGVAEKSADLLKKKYPNVNIIGTHHGYFENDEAIVSQIEFLRPDILIVCLGMLKQELWIQKNIDRLKIPVSFGNGGAFDFTSGKIKRAPLWVQRLGMEWFYRLLKEPKRINRQRVLPLFVLLVLKQVLREKFLKKSDKPL